MNSGKKRHKMIVLFAAFVIGASLLSILIQGQVPTPHNVQGRIFTNNSNGVQNGIPVLINNTVSGAMVLTAVSAPPAPPQRGSYSATISGNDGDQIVVTSWNKTHFGNASANLLTTTTTVNVNLNRTRSSEANVSILYPVNNTVRNKSIDFNVTLNITMMGSDGINCNATISFSNASILNVSPFQNTTIVIGNIAFETHKNANWSIRGYKNGTSNISVFVYCESDSRYFDNINRRSASNITIAIVPPLITRTVMHDPIDLVAGTNTSLFCNATILDGNTASDIRLVNLTFFQNSSGFSAADDRNYHYTNASCHNVSSSLFEINFTCGVSAAYFANNGSWNCNITVSDFDNFTNFSNAPTRISELLAIDVSPLVLDYGELSVGQTSSNNVNATVSNVGNIPFNITLHGFGRVSGDNLSMNCTKGNISIDSERYFIGPNVNYDSMINLTWNATLVKNVSFLQRTDDLNKGNDTNVTFWKVSIPPLVRGQCNGSVIFNSFSIA